MGPNGQLFQIKIKIGQQTSFAFLHGDSYKTLETATTIPGATTPTVDAAGSREK